MKGKAAAPVEYQIPPIPQDDEVTVRHVGGGVERATLWYIDAETVHLRFGMAGVRVATLVDIEATRSRHALPAGRFKDKKMASWRIDAIDLERLRVTAREHKSLYERLKDERYGQKDTEKKRYGEP